MNSKVCLKCNIEKFYINFSIRKDSKDGYRNTCKSCENIIKNNWKKNNPEYINSYKLSYKKRKNENYNFRKKNDVVFKVKESIRLLIINSIKSNSFSKKSKTFDILGCSVDEFKLYIESKFDNWMNWDNHGKYDGNFNIGWDIDHIIPLSSAITQDDVVKLNHFTNFQPLDSKINREIKRGIYDTKVC